MERWRLPAASASVNGDIPRFPANGDAAQVGLKKRLRADILGSAVRSKNAAVCRLADRCEETGITAVARRLPTALAPLIAPPEDVGTHPLPPTQVAARPRSLTLVGLERSRAGVAVEVATWIR